MCWSGHGFLVISWRGGNLTSGSLVLSFSLLFIFADFFLNTVAGFSTSSSPNGARGAFSNPPGVGPEPVDPRHPELEGRRMTTTSPTRTPGQASTKLGRISWPPIGWAHAASWIPQCGAGVPRLLFAATLQLIPCTEWVHCRTTYCLRTLSWTHLLGAILSEPISPAPKSSEH